jgi:hypothetical protein
LRKNGVSHETFCARMTFRMNAKAMVMMRMLMTRMMMVMMMRMMMMMIRMMMGNGWVTATCSRMRIVFSPFPPANAVCVVVPSATSRMRVERKGTKLATIRSVRTIRQLASSCFSRCSWSRRSPSMPWPHHPCGRSRKSQCFRSSHGLPSQSCSRSRARSAFV